MLGGSACYGKSIYHLFGEQFLFAFNLCGQVAGESTNKIPVQFRFITTNTTLQQVVDKVGKYDRVRGAASHITSMIWLVVRRC